VENILPKEEFEGKHVNDPCVECGNVGENWICLKSKVVCCSRYVKSHGLAYYNKTKNPIAFSFADFSYWCYECDEYVEHPLLNHSKFFYSQKFGGNEG
jgi:histone deacetylase 6